MTTEVTTDKATVTVYTDTHNKRIRIDDYAGEKEEVLRIVNKQVSDWVEKLIIKSYAVDVPFFMSQGFSCEGFIKGYYSGADMYFVARYFSAERERKEKWEEEQLIIQKLIHYKSKIESPSTEDIKVATPIQAEELAALYNLIFKFYPTPVSDVTHIVKTMQEGTIYAYIEQNNRIVSVASAEINRKHNNAELTDCATLPVAEGKGHMKKLLFFLEQKLQADGIRCAYTLARAQSFSMNKAFAQLGYTYGGRLVNNCYIYSGIEDMNVWYKSL